MILLPCTIQIQLIKAYYCCCMPPFSANSASCSISPGDCRLGIIAVQMQRKLIPLLFAFNLQTYFSSTLSTYELITNKLEKFYFLKNIYISRALYLLLRAANKVCGNQVENTHRIIAAVWLLQMSQISVQILRDIRYFLLDLPFLYFLQTTAEAGEIWWQWERWKCIMVFMYRCF